LRKSKAAEVAAATRTPKRGRPCKRHYALALWSAAVLRRFFERIAGEIHAHYLGLQKISGHGILIIPLTEI
jgi:hypothetical protein